MLNEVLHTVSTVSYNKLFPADHVLTCLFQQNKHLILYYSISALYMTGGSMLIFIDYICYIADWGTK